MTAFTAAVLRIIQNIPSGKVMTYGQIARLAGNPRAARQVVRILHSMSDAHRLPWHRVVNAKGQIMIADEAKEIQMLSLESEGIEMRGHLVDLQQYQFHPDEIV
ncbi:MGMT family protein [Ectobacillus antri]|uniref:MGMT family protein n=1 Tax=Ectobacillus antri TaxID=2486280 RepID=UPI000F5AB84A|nr:MGMT family protein [Ectobacillus antri]